MALPRTTRWPIQPHTKIKHLILRKYLDAWLPIMARYNGRIVFIDGFAGPGRYTGGEEGSPIIALRALLDHPHFREVTAGKEVVFIFVENDPERAAALRAELEALKKESKFPAWVKVQAIEEEFAGSVGGMLDAIGTSGSRLAPTFAFIDPFGFAGVPMDVIAKIGANRGCECLITFMYESVNRFLAHPDEAIQRRFDELFGTPDWRELSRLTDGDARRNGLIRLYERQLRERAGFRYVRAFEMINEGNRTEYFLFFGTNAKTGLSKMKQAMWKADPDSGEVFSDRSNPDQMVLLRPDAEGGLTALLREKYAGTGFAEIAEVERFVLEETAYSEAIHLKRRTLKPMEMSNPPKINVRRPPDSPNRKGTYPPGTRIRFR